MNIRPKKGVIYECYYGGTDQLGNRIRRGTRVVIDFKGAIHDYFKRESGRGCKIVLEREDFVKHFVPAAK
jgi:hypothetical protein